MKSWIKVTGVLFVFLLMALGAALFYASTLITPEKIRQTTVETLEETFPGGEVSLGKIDYSVGLKFKLDIESLSIKLKQGKGQLFDLKNLEVFIPFWAILTGGGDLSIEIDSPTLFYHQYANKKSNWDLALGDKKKSELAAKGNDSKDESIEFTVPAFAEDSRLNVRVANLAVRVTNPTAEKTELVLNKIILKNLNLKKSSAYEIESHITQALKEGELKTHIQLVGDINLAEYLKNKILTSRFAFKMTDTQVPMTGVKIPNIETKGEVVLKENGQIHIKNNLEVGSVLNYKGEMLLTDKELILNGTKLEVVLSEIQEVLPQMEASLKGINLNSSELHLAGDARFNTVQKKLKTDINFKLTKELILNTLLGFPATMKLQGTYKNGEVKASNTLSMYSGDVVTSVVTKIDPLNLPSQINKWNTIKVSSVLTGLKLKERDLEKFQSSNNETSSAPKTTAGKAKTHADPVLLPPVELSIDGRNLFLGNREFSLRGKILTKDRRVNIQNFLLSQGGGKFNVKSSVLLNKKQEGNFVVNINNFNINGFSALFPSYARKAKGITNGKITGHFSLYPLAYMADTDIQLLNGKVKDLNVNQMVNALFDSLKDKMPKKETKVTEGFDLLLFKGVARENKVQVKKLKIVGNKKSFELDTSGHIGMHERSKSKLQGDFQSPEVKSSLKMKKLPVRFTGRQFSLMPDLPYILGKVANAQAKLAGQKAVKKQKKKLEKELKKKAKNLLKGFKF